MFVQSFATFGLDGLSSESRDIRLVIRNVFSNGGGRRVPAFLLLLLFLLVLLNFSVCEVTTILLEVFELVRYGTKALFGEETTWLEDLGLANKEVTSLKLRFFFKFFFEKFNDVTNKLRP